MEELNTFKQAAGEPRICFATVTNEAFAVAAEVLLYSFIKFNPWFDGDVVVVETGDLSDQTRERLNNIYPVRFIQSSPELETRMDDLISEIPWLVNKRAHFHVFELFQLTDYQHIVYVDGDTYCCGDIRELFYREEPFLACPDAFTLRRQLWDRLADHAPEQLPEASPYGPDVGRSFNSGVMSINGELINRQTYLGLLEVLNPQVFERSDFGDQMALNVYFKGQFTSISACYNYMVLIEEYVKGLEDITSLDARIVHFAGRIKPWFEFAYPEVLEKAPHYLKFIDNWQELLRAARHQQDLPHIAEQVARQRAWSRKHAGELSVENIKRIS